MINNLIIFGDSYSTYEGCIPEGYASYYAPSGESPRQMRKEETWWQRLINATEANLIQNNSWSGSTISYTGYAGDCTTSSFIYRYRQLKEKGFFDNNKIDTVIVFGGTNDSWVPSPLGEGKLSDWEESELFCALPAISYFMSILKRDMPYSRIVFIANCDINPEIINFIKSAGKHFGVEVVELHDVDKQCGHPTVLGMEQICTQVLDSLRQER